MVAIYAEKYSLAKTIASALGAGQRIPCADNPAAAHWEFDLNGESAVLCHGAGHLAEFVPAKEYDEKFLKWDLDAFPCIPEKLKIKPSQNTSELFEYVSGFMRKADWLINAADPDREGELIFAYVTELIFGNNVPPWKRVLLPDLLDKTIVTAFQNLKDGSAMLPLQLAGRARSAADWITGCNLTIAMTKKFGSPQNLLSIGRVQTPVLALVTENSRQIKNHVKKPFYKLMCVFENDGGKRVVSEHEAGKFDNAKEAENIISDCKEKTGIVTVKKLTSKSVSAPKLYNSTALMAQAGTEFGWELSKSAAVMQSLYEKKLMSYPRTSSEYLTEDMKQSTAVTIERLMKLDELKEYYLPKEEWREFSNAHFDTSKVGSHTAIIPTEEVPANLSSLTDDEKILYCLSAKSLIMTVYPQYETEKTDITISVEGHNFHLSGVTVINDGWRKVDRNGGETSKTGNLPAGINEGDKLSASKFEIKEGFTEPPKRYTEASLILTMEAAGHNLEDKEAVELMKLRKTGLGTDATRASIIQNLFAKNLIMKKGRSIFPTEKGEFLIDNLAVQEIKSAEMTGQWEKRLNDIAESDENAPLLYQSFMNDVKTQVKKWYNTIKNSSGGQYFGSDEIKMICPFCGSRMFKGKFGYACGGYKEGCKFQIGYEICGRKITESQAAMLVSSGKTAVIKHFTGKNGRIFNAALGLDRKNKSLAFIFDNGERIE